MERVCKSERAIYLLSDYKSERAYGACLQIRKSVWSVFANPKEQTK
jgi:hypothetical protein